MENKATNVLDILSQEHHYQRRMLAFIFHHRDWDVALNLVSEDDFTNVGRKLLYSFASDYFLKYKKTITKAVLQHHIKTLDNDMMREEVITELSEINKIPVDGDIEYFQDIVKTNSYNTKIKEGIIKAADLFQAGNNDALRKLFLELSTENNTQEEFLDISDFDNWLIPEARNTISTGYPYLDNLLYGGLGIGELGVVIGSSGAGKSWVLSALGLNAMKQGKNVLHVTLELVKTQVSNRYGSLLTGINSHELINSKDKVKNAFSKVSGKLIIEHPSRKISVTAINSMFRRHKDINLIIVDYGDLLESTSRYKYAKENTYLEQGEVYNEMRFLASTLGIPIWTASQSHRMGFDRKHIDDNDIADSFKKVMVADFVMSIYRKDKVEPKATYKIIKNRFGYDGHIFSSDCDFGKGLLKIEKTETEKKVGEKNLSFKEQAAKVISENKEYNKNRKETIDGKGFE